MILNSDTLKKLFIYITCIAVLLTVFFALIAIAQKYTTPTLSVPITLMDKLYSQLPSWLRNDCFLQLKKSPVDGRLVPIDINGEPIGILEKFPETNEVILLKPDTSVTDVTSCIRHTDINNIKDYYRSTMHAPTARLVPRENGIFITN